MDPEIETSILIVLLQPLMVSSEACNCHKSNEVLPAVALYVLSLKSVMVNLTPAIYAMVFSGFYTEESLRKKVVFVLCEIQTKIYESRLWP